ncbi:MAG: hypothetical protein ABEJ61_03535 [Haloferacaceae archaeon]
MPDEPDASDGADDAVDPEADSGADGSSTSASTAPWMTTDLGGGENTTLAEIAEEEPEPDRSEVGYLPHLPDIFVTLGAGCLATSSMITLVAFGYVIWMMQTGNVGDLFPYQVTLAAIQMGFATLLLASGSYFAVKRTRWTFVMLAALVGSFAVLTIPFTAVAVVTIGLGRIHFRAPFIDSRPTSDEG